MWYTDSPELFVPEAFTVLLQDVKVRNIVYAVNQWKVSHPWVVKLSVGPSALKQRSRFFVYKCQLFDF